VDGLLAAGITPSVTLYHWDLPQTLQDRGGWPVRDTAEHFAAYASAVAGRPGDRAHHWATLNEPLSSASLRHLRGRLAPGPPHRPAAVRASHPPPPAPRLPTPAGRAGGPGAPVGIVHHPPPRPPASGPPEGLAPAARMGGHPHPRGLGPVHGRGFPTD